MSGKPGATKPAPSSPKKRDPKQKPKAQSKSKPQDDNPFEKPPAKSATAIQAAPKPMKGRLLKVECPMCDTPGFIPKKAAGRDVRCANKKCMVPVFQAPALEKKVVEPEEPEQSSSMVPIIAGVALLLVVGGVGFALMGGDDNSGNNTKLGPQPKTGPTDTPDVDPKTPVAPVAEAKTAFALRKEVFAALQKAAEGNRKADRPFCRRMEAEGFAAMGRGDSEVVAKAGLIDLNTAQDHFQVFPLLDAAWRHIDKANTQQAGVLIAQALEPAKGVSAFGRGEFDVRIALAAAMAGAGQSAAAVETITSARSLEEPLDIEAARAAAAVAIAIAAADTGTTCPEAVTEWQNPLWPATAVLLCIRGQAGAAVELTKSITDEVIRADTLAAIVTVEAANGRDVSDAVTAASDSAMAARVNAAAAYGASGVDVGKAGGYLDAAAIAAGTLPEPKPLPVPTVKAFYESEYPEETPSIMASLAFAELARAEAELGRKSSAETLLKAIYHAHSFCHPPAFATTWQERLAGPAARVRATLARELNLNEQATRTAMGRFKTKMLKLEERVAKRVDLQSDMLSRVAASKLSGNAWALVNPATIKDSLLRAEGVADSPLPWRVVLGMFRVEDKNAAAAKSSLGSAPEVVLGEALNASVVNSPRRAGRVLSPPQAIQVSRVRPILRFTERFVSMKTEAAIDFARAMQNAVWRREMLRLIGARAGRTEELGKLDEIVAGLKFESPERTAIYRGLITGLSNHPEFKSPPAK